MTRKISTTMFVAIMLLLNQFSFAGATEDLWKALKAANDKDALAAIAAGADVNNVDASASTPLCLAACFSGGEVVKALIDGKAEVNYVQPSNGFTPLHNAANWGNTDAVKILLAAGADVKIKDKFGRPILTVALACVKLDLIKLLVEAGADPNEKFKFVGQDQCVLMFLIASYTPADKVKNLEATKPNIEKLGLTFPERIINAKESDFTPLGEIAAYLISKGADPNFKNGGWGCILNQAISFKKPDIAIALVNAKADLTITMRVKGKVSGFDGTPLMLASILGYTELVDLICKSGADINVASKEQSSSTTVSAGVGTTTYSTTTTRKYNNALSLAIDNKQTEVVAILKKYKAKEPK